MRVNDPPVVVRWPPISKIVLGSSVLLHAATLPLFLLVVIPGKLFSDSPYVFYFFLVLSVTLAAGMYIVHRRVYLRALFFARAAMLLLFASPFGLYLGIRMVLLLALLLETSIYEDFPINLIFCLLLLLGGLGITALQALLNRDVRPAFVHDLILYAISTALIAGVGSAMTFYREGMVRHGREMEKLAAIVEKLTRAQMGYLEFAKTAEERSTQSERNRLSGELHDSIGYAFTNLRMMLEAGKDLIKSDPSRLSDLLETGLAQVEQARKETRKALYLLRENEVKPPFLSAVHKMVEVFEKATGVHVIVDYANFPMDCGEQVELALYHFIQESLVNAFTHGKASRVQVLFWMDEEMMQVSVADNGRGIGTILEGIGIRGMRERLGKLGGTLVMQNLPVGFQIMAQFPLNG